MSKKGGMAYHCDVCGAQTARDDYHDAYYCKECDRWQEDACESSTCQYCVGRPARPSQVRNGAGPTAWP